MPLRSHTIRLRDTRSPSQRARQPRVDEQRQCVADRSTLHVRNTSGMLSVILIFMMRASRVLATCMTAQVTIVATSSRPRRVAAIGPLQERPRRLSAASTSRTTCANRIPATIQNYQGRTCAHATVARSVVSMSTRPATNAVIATASSATESVKRKLSRASNQRWHRRAPHVLFDLASSRSTR